MSEPSPPAGGRAPDEPDAAGGGSRPSEDISPERIEAAIAAAEARVARYGEEAEAVHRRTRKRGRSAGALLALVGLVAIGAAAYYAYGLAGRPLVLPWLGGEAGNGAAAPQEAAGDAARESREGSGTAPAPGEDALSAEELREMEELLERLAFRPGPVDGVVDERTEVAIRAFQRTAGLSVDGEASARVLRELRAVVELIDEEG